MLLNSERKQKLLELGEDRLADALLELANQNDAANDLVERMIATPQENIKRFKAKLAGLKRSRRFIGWGESAGFARELVALLEDLRAGVEDPRTGAELVAVFYEADVGILAHCDDSSGNVGDLFRHDARELFVSYASRCADKEWLGDRLAGSVSDWRTIKPHAAYVDGLKLQHGRKSSFWSRYGK